MHTALWLNLCNVSPVINLFQYFVSVLQKRKKNEQKPDYKDANNHTQHSSEIMRDLAINTII